jgi:hypothetical protein
MKIFRLVKYFDHKYSLKSLAASKEETLDQVKTNLINAYNLYVNSSKAKEPVLQMLANAKEPFSKKLISSMEELVANINKLSAQLLFKRVVGILDSIRNMKNDPEKTVRNFIHDSVRVNKESDRNYREHMKSKFEMVISRIFSIFEKQGRILQSVIALETPEVHPMGSEEIGGPVRKELSKDKILMFMKSPAAQDYGLDDLETMTRVLSYPDLKSKITTLINAVDRGHVPIDGPEVKSDVEAIMKIYQDRQHTNIPALEEMPEKPEEFGSILGDT